MTEPHSTIAGSLAGAGVSSITLFIGAQVDALVIGALAAIFVSIWLQTIDKFHKALAAVLFSALLAGYGSPVAAEWVMGSLPSVAGSHEALRLLLALIIGALAPSIVPLAIRYANGKVQGAAMNIILTILMLASASIVAWHCLRIAASINSRNWFGHRLEFFFVAASYSGLFAGALGIALGWPPARELLLLGVAGLIIFDRRRT